MKPWKQTNRLKKGRFGERWTEHPEAFDTVADTVRSFVSLPDCLKAMRTEDGPPRIFTLPDGLSHALSPERVILRPSDSRRRRGVLSRIIAAAESEGASAALGVVDRELEVIASRTLDAYEKSISPASHRRNDDDLDLIASRDLAIVRAVVLFFVDPDSYVTQRYELVMPAADDPENLHSNVRAFCAKWGSHAFRSSDLTENFAKLPANQQEAILSEIKPGRAYTEEPGPGRTPTIDPVSTILDVGDERDRIADEAREDFVPRARGIRAIAKKTGLKPATIAKRVQRAGKTLARKR